MGSKRLKVQHKQIAKNNEAGYNALYVDNSLSDPSDVPVNMHSDTSREDIVTGEEEEEVRPREGLLNNFDELVESLPNVAV